MRKLLLALCAAATAVAAGAVEAGDTTVVYQGKTFVLGTDSSETKVAVYESHGAEMKKTHESSYVDGREIEQVYITSPFLPQKRSPRRYRDHIPEFYYGMAPLAGSVGGFNGAAGCIPTRASLTSGDSRCSAWAYRSITHILSE